MLQLSEILLGGGLLSLAIGAVILTSLIVNPRIWLNDYPEPIRQLAAPLTSNEKRLQYVFMVPFLLAFLLVPYFSTRALVQAGGVSFVSAYAHAFLVLNIANLFDAVVIDWLFLSLMKPRFAIIPEAWGHFDLMGGSWQVRNYVKGIALCAVLAAPIALAATLI
ncbi:MAG: hypothetical protein KC547_13640 [Anaerolineae bacterium]|nr:hypothetical protein [Anaerolineae bacterium]MCA9907213.1 hypothetical protein [Anaerolineae bacterium]